MEDVLFLFINPYMKGIFFISCPYNNNKQNFVRSL